MESEQTRREIRAADDLRIKAFLDKDYVALASIFSDKLVYHHASGKVDSKESYLEPFRSGKIWFAANEREETSTTVADDSEIGSWHGERSRYA
jgi:hypothetical protein